MVPYATRADPPLVPPNAAAVMDVSVMTGVTAAAAKAADAAQLICRQVPSQ